MTLSTLHNVRFAGMASCVPRQVVHNINDVPPHLRSERERLVRNIGILTRRVCPSWQCFSDLAFDAAEKLLTELQWAREEVDALIVVTQSPDYLTPATAIILQDRLGLPHGTVAFDVNLGCSGYPFAVQILGSMVASGVVKKGLILLGDRSSYKHRDSLKDPLFSDAATATALEYQPGAPPMHFDLNSDGSGHKAIMVPVGGHRQPFELEHAIARKGEDGFWYSNLDLVLDGPAVLSFSTQRVPPMVERLMQYSGRNKEEVDYFIFHQANRMINETIRKKLGLPAEKVPSSLQEFGNTSGASLPVTMTTRLRDALAEGKKRLLLCGFGVGLSWGGAIVEVESACFPALVEA
ncbi:MULTISPECIES: ketoacyl-ACP synthase III [Delftia]|jgi:3-oxoacyl-[acyl-carrier-protein] synthase-3|uniref:Ketoacyl-ACP synthase III n=1 Tax=Delftia acidovorans TaxID=80866 RepID=A0AAJ2VCT4_DELAC|nr:MULTISPECIES: ketoacyl-ACP synthase III [Delftia]EZP53428.1 3-oxoacyl-[acyl-carrier-protein] synthase III [Delftia sp. RIT313]KZK30171.1 3-oxoacyl-ACP synthase [Delftia sp. GW456-R20]MDX4957661.1 ketoacyl-ACP synthase III [Delftia acidovorans]